MCPCGTVRSPAGSGGGRVYIGACAGGITVVCWMAVSSLSVYEAVASMVCSSKL